MIISWWRHDSEALICFYFRNKIYFISPISNKTWHFFLNLRTSKSFGLNLRTSLFFSFLRLLLLFYVSSFILYPDRIQGHWGSCKEKPEILENAYSGEVGMKLGGKNKSKSLIPDWHNWTGPALYWELGGADCQCFGELGAFGRVRVYY